MTQTNLEFYNELMNLAKQHPLLIPNDVNLNELEADCNSLLLLYAILDIPEIINMIDEKYFENGNEEK